ncbi:MAG: hypothetical protein ACYTGG_13065 [Planctomycetota bacterium]|jgi:hypothetical protein
MVIRLICLIGPVVLAPLLVMAVRPTFSMFLREATEVFASVHLQKPLADGIARYLAIINVAILVAAWAGSFGCRWAEGPHLVSLAAAVGGVMLALGATILIVRSRVGIIGAPAYLIGLVSFGGGNLPLFVGVPIVWVIT